MMNIATVGNSPQIEAIRFLLTQNNIPFEACSTGLNGIENPEKLEDSFLIFLDTSPEEIRSCCRSASRFISGRHAIVHTSLHLEEKSGFTISRVLEEELPTQRIAFITGPMRLHDVEKSQPTSALCASRFSEISDLVDELLENAAFRLYRSHDLIGAELTAIYARVIAFATGIGYQLGDSVQSILFTRGLAEASRFVTQQGGDSRTCFGLAGTANLFLEIHGEGSFDFKLGRALTKTGKVPKTFLQKHKDEIRIFKKLVNVLLHTTQEGGDQYDILKASSALLEGQLTPLGAMEKLMSLPSRFDF